MSNYPPGVTGNEPEIAGYPERETEKTCGAEDVEVTVLTKDGIASLKNTQRDLEAMYERMSSTTPRDIGIPWVLRRLKSMAADTELVVLEKCPFEGDVVQYLVNNEWVWECPVCGTEHEEENE